MELTTLRWCVVLALLAVVIATTSVVTRWLVEVKLQPCSPTHMEALQ